MRNERFRAGEPASHAKRAGPPASAALAGAVIVGAISWLIGDVVPAFAAGVVASAFGLFTERPVATPVAHVGSAPATGMTPRQKTS